MSNFYLPAVTMSFYDKIAEAQYQQSCAARNYAIAESARNGTWQLDENDPYLPTNPAEREALRQKLMPGIAVDFERWGDRAAELAEEYYNDAARHNWAQRG